MLRNEARRPAFVAMAVLVVYANALNGAFQFDDYNVIVNNPAVHSVAAWWDSMPGIRALLKLSFALNWSVDTGPVGFLLVNAMIHAANAVLVYLILRSVCERHPDRDWVPMIGAMLFALHPVQTEAVTYVSGRSVSLMALCYLGAALAWVQANGSPRSRQWRALSAGLFGAALLVRETAVTLPFALLLLDITGVRGRFTAVQMLRRLGWHWFILAGGFLTMIASPTYRHLLEVSITTRSVIDNLLTQVNAVFYLVLQLFRPWGMNSDPDLPVLGTLSPVLTLQMAVIVMLVAIGIGSLRRQPWLGFALLWFMLHLLPTNSLVPRLDVANDRQLYLASIGVFFAVGVVAQELAGRPGRRWFVGATMMLGLLGLGYATVQRNGIYATAVAYWEDAAIKSPRKPRVANNLGFAYQQAGRLEEAKQAYQRAIDLDPDYWKARINLDIIESSAPR